MCWLICGRQDIPRKQSRLIYKQVLPWIELHGSARLPAKLKHLVNGAWAHDVFAVETVRWQDHFLPGPVQGLCNLGLISLAFLFFALDSR